MARAFITGTAGFIGFHLARSMLREGWGVHGFDAVTDYYDVALKRRRLALLAEEAERAGARHVETEARLEDSGALDRALDAARPEVVVHLAAQAGVRYSLANPRAYLDANVTGTFNLMEAVRRRGDEVRHLMMASTSSVYGANAEMPYGENDKADTPMSFYAATKKATEAMGHAYAHLHAIPTTMFRFFTVYGPWGRPDMAPDLFAGAILAGRPINLYNHGRMFRDFTYIDDLIRGIRLLIDAAPPPPAARGAGVAGDSLSPVAPWRVVNIGNSERVALLDFVAAIEAATGRAAIRNLMEMQPGDVPATWADAGLLGRLTGYRPQTDVREGVARFVTWYRDYHGC